MFPYRWKSIEKKSYVFSTDERFSGRQQFKSSGILERSDTTDENGSAKLSLNPAIEPTAQPRTYVIEATVTGADDQTVTTKLMI
ncbi:MAG: hypothetical protein JW841_11545 [Deltaproteobacteria bacterium]|nr:hypothetical protein [Deltaproteobacteria bacterium]